ncbi:methyltransferase domain-containing protein [Streptomyces sp. TRM68367]|uniref:methyltransferase domain-containing protein n=1 Tax=Streptomyces sp. TRM68367 TaxID=2758415 RepID=UPI001CA95D40|nr:methyltransferase domain-containing protein [Streptomyces sp. TRM68367]
MHTPLVARCLRGLEHLVAAEILESGLGAVTAIHHREVRFHASSPTAPWPRTADDTFLLTAERPDIGPAKRDLRLLAELADLIDADQLLAYCRELTVPDARELLVPDSRDLTRPGRQDPGASDRRDPTAPDCRAPQAPDRRDPATLDRRDPPASDRRDLTTSDRRARTTPDHTTGIDVSASFLGRRSFTRYDAEDAVGQALALRLGVAYHPRRTGAAAPPGSLGWRLTLDGTRATLMLRIADRPLHRRAYKHRTIPGTLHPPLAAAMATLAGIRPGDVVLDPCCGAGTLLIEAALAHPGARYHGFDLSSEAITAARANAADALSDVRSVPPNAAHAPSGVRNLPPNAAHTLPDAADAPSRTRNLPNARDARPTPGDTAPPLTIHRSDAAHLPLPDASVDRVLCNPPWGTQAPARGLLAADPSRWWAELRRVLAPDGTAVLLLPDAQALTGALRHGLTPVHLRRVRLFGAQPLLVQLTSTDAGRDRRSAQRRATTTAGGPRNRTR